MTDRDPDDLEVLFAQARRTEAAVTDDLMARVLADAARVQPTAARQVPHRPSAGPLVWLRDAIGGWPAWGGVIAAGLTGLWVGVAPPAAIESLAADVIGTTQAVTFLPDADLSLFEEASDG